MNAFTGTSFEPVFQNALLRPAISSATLQNGVMTILFSGGELETAPGLDGPWSATGDSSGSYSEPAGTDAMRFYRVRGTAGEP